jgi:hypothetical protein
VTIFEKIWKEAAITYFKALFQNKPGGNEENNERSDQYNRSSG